MLAFYGWTDLQLINHVHVKAVCFKNEDADLFVLKIPRISKALLNEIIKMKVFSNIYELTPSQSAQSMNTAQKIWMLFSKNKLFKHYKMQLPIGKVYSEFFTGALWSDARYIIRNLKVTKVNFVEEGTATYDGIEVLSQCMPRPGFKERLLRRIHFPRDSFALGKIYMYKPEMCKSSCGLTITKLPIIKAGSVVHNVLINTEGDITPFKEAKHIFIAGRGEAPPLDLPPNTFVKFHPADKPSLPMEWVYAQVDMNQKVLIISSKSTAIYTPQIMFGDDRRSITWKL